MVVMVTTHNDSFFNRLLGDSRRALPLCEDAIEPWSEFQFDDAADLAAQFSADTPANSAEKNDLDIAAAEVSESNLNATNCAKNTDTSPTTRDGHSPANLRAANSQAEHQPKFAAPPAASQVPPDSPQFRRRNELDRNANISSSELQRPSATPVEVKGVSEPQAERQVDGDFDKSTVTTNVKTTVGQVEEAPQNMLHAAATAKVATATNSSNSKIPESGLVPQAHMLQVAAQAAHHSEQILPERDGVKLGIGVATQVNKRAPAARGIAPKADDRTGASGLFIGEVKITVVDRAQESLATHQRGNSRQSPRTSRAGTNDLALSRNDSGNFMRTL